MDFRTKIRELIKTLIENIHERRKLILALSCVVVFVTTYVLILPAFTLDKEEAAEQGGIDVPVTQSLVNEDEGLNNEPVQDGNETLPASGNNTKKPAISIKNDKADALKYESDDYNISITDDKGILPDDTAIHVEEIIKEESDKTYDKYFNKALAAIKDEKDGNKDCDLEFAKFYDISLISEGKEIEPEHSESVNVKIEYDKAIRKSLGVEDVDNVRIIHFIEDAKTKEIEAEILDPKDNNVKVETDRNDQLLSAEFEAGSFSVYAVVYTSAQIQKDFIAASGKTFEASVTYGEEARIPDGATLKITEFAKDSDEYKASREFVVDKKQSEDSSFDEKDLSLVAFDISILDKDGKQVEPEAAVDVSVTMKSLPEEIVEAEAQDSIEIHHLDESSKNITVEEVASAADGSIQIKSKSAQAEFQLESFSTFTVSWNRRSTNNSTTTFGWQDRNNTARGFITAQYQDESGNAIQRPDSINYTVYHGGFNNGVTNTFNIASDLGRNIPGYTFTRAYVTVTATVDGVEQKTENQVDSVTATRSGDVTTVTYYYNGQEVLSASYDATYAQNKRHDFTPDGLGLTLVYTKNNDFTTVHYGYMDGNTFKEFDEQPNPTNTSTSFGWAHLIYDFAGTDDKGLHVDWKYKGTYYHTSETTNPEQGGAAMQPILRFNNNRWRYYTGSVDTYGPFRQNNNWHEVADNSDIYVVYEKPTIPMGGTPVPSESAEQPDKPYILKESVENTDGTNTLSLSVTGSRAPMIAEKVADVIVILDLSSSMRRDIGSQTTINNYQSNPSSRYYQAKQAVQKLADKLYEVNGDDGLQYRMGLITFSNKATIRQYPTEDKATFQSTLNRITEYEGSGTNWEHSLQLANQMAVSSDRATYIVFITDGEPSVRQTRGNLTNEQLSGVNNTSSPATEGDIFHGGRSGGRFFNDGGYWDDTDTPDFRDYFGSATFGGLMNNEVWDARNRNAGVDEVASIVGHNKGFYAIGVSREVNSLGDFVEAGGVDSNHYKLVTSATAFQEVIDDILEELDIGGSSGQANVKIYDGITDLTQTIAKVNKEENRLIGVDGNFTYWKSNPPQITWDEVKATWSNELKEVFALGAANASNEGIPDGYASWSKTKKAAYELGKQSVHTSEHEAKNPADLWAGVWESWDESLKGAYGAGVEHIGSDETPEDYSSWNDDKKAAYAIGKKITFSEWTTRQADGCAEAEYNTETGAVVWNMGEKFMLEDGVTYKVSFICWPSQEAYDIIAKLNNGTITFGDTALYPQEVWDQFEGDATNGYRVKTNEEGANTVYNKATNVNGTVTVGDKQDPLPFQHVPPMPLEKDKIKVAKTWQASKIDSQDPESVVLQVVGDDELYKQFEITPTDKVDDSETNNWGRSGDIFISCGHLKVDKTTGEVVVYENGHDFTLREVEENSRHWDLDASVCRPMKINTVERMLVAVDDDDIPSGMSDDKDYYASGNDEYYRIDGKVYKDNKAWADITGMNTRRSFLDLAKEVVVNNEVWTEEVDPKFTYKIKIDIDPTTYSWDPDIEKYIIISIRGAGYSPAAAIADQTYPTTAVLPSQSGMDSSLIHDHYDDLYLVAKSGEEFYLSIKNGWSVRFLNLPAGTTYSIEEVLPDDSDYTFNNARLETRKDRSSTEPLSTDTYQTEKVDGSIAETSTLYKVVYQNEPETQDIKILKVSQDTTTLLGGAKFDLYTEKAYTSDPQGEPLQKDLVSSSDTETKGQIDLGTLPAGIYYLVETEAPAGHILKGNPVIITVTKTGVTYDDGTALSQSVEGVTLIGDTYQLKVTNDAGAELPHAGGIGTTIFYVLGTMLVLGCGVYLIARRRIRQ